VPANLENNIVGDIKKLALKAYNILCCEDYARVDMFLDAAGTVFINEINTIPGFTEFSMFPLLMKTAGVSFDELVDKLLTYALTKKS
jgi:D-alanine-D-alanine ligase